MPAYESQKAENAVVKSRVKPLTLLNSQTALAPNWNQTVIIVEIVKRAIQKGQQKRQYIPHKHHLNQSIRVLNIVCVV